MQIKVYFFAHLLTLIYFNQVMTTFSYSSSKSREEIFSRLYYTLYKTAMPNKADKNKSKGLVGLVNSDVNMFSQGKVFIDGDSKVFATVHHFQGMALYLVAISRRLFGLIHMTVHF